MSDHRNDTTRWKQLAEWAAVKIIGISYSVASPDLPIKWVQERKIIRGSKDENGPAIRFLFAVELDSKEFPLLTAVEVLLAPNGKGWKCVSAKLERNYSPGKPNTEKWGFLPDETPQQVI